jgi:O-succinylbenzoic acid--CoA ligase
MLAAMTNVPDWLDSAAASRPDRVALRFGNEQWTYSELRHAVDTAGSILSREQREIPYRIGVLASNRPGVVFAFHAARRLEAEFVPLNWRQTIGELAWQVQDAGISVLVADEERLASARDMAEGPRIPVTPIADIEIPPTTCEVGPLRLVDLQRNAAVLFTSGTTGRPKGAQLTHGNLWSSAVASALHLGHHRNDVWLATLPLYHIGGLSILFRAVVTATPVVLHDRFDAERANAAIDDGATLVSLVPTMLQRMIEQRGDAPYPVSLRTVLLGGSATPPGLVVESIQRGIPIAPTYGLTETASQVTTLLPERVANKPGSSGQPLPGTQVRIATVIGATNGEEFGHIEVRGPTVFAGYLGREEPQSQMTAEGWFRTGDLGYLDGEGYLYVLDRRDDLIVSGGENVSPAETERILLEHPNVSDAAVVGLPDARWGNRPVAVVVWQGDPTAAEDVLIRYCRERLAGYKVPARVHIASTLPRSPSGKLLRRQVRASLEGTR